MAPSKTLYRRVQALRAQCRAFSGTVQACRPSGNTPHADMMGIFQQGIARATSKSEQQARTGRAAGLLSTSIRENPAQSRIALETGFRTADFDSAHARRYVPGDVIAPHDLSFEETAKWRHDAKKRPKQDIFDVLGLDPREEYKNFGLLGEFVTDMGRIKGRIENGLRGRNQRRIAKAIKRATGMGLVPTVSRHPVILETELTRNRGYRYRKF